MHMAGSMELLKIPLKCKLMHIMAFDKIAHVLTSILFSIGLAAISENG